MMNRRHFLRASGLSIAGLGLGGGLGGPALANTNNNRLLLTVFLRGGVDGMSMVQPRPGNTAPRQRYEQWRRAATRVQGSLPLSGDFGMHPAFESLRHAFNAGHASFITSVGGARENRSHFEQMNLVESGTGASGAPLREGVLGRAFGELTPQQPGLARLALNSQAPFLLTSQDSSALSTASLRSFGELRHDSFGNNSQLDLRERVRRMYTPSACTTDICDAGRQAYSALDAMQNLKNQANVQGGGGTALHVLLDDMAKLIGQDSAGAFKFLSLDVGGWDTHTRQGDDTKSGNGFNGDLARKLEALSLALAGFYDQLRALGQWSRVSVLVITEFGRTVRDNGGGGTDHGYGSTALLLGHRVARPLVADGYFPSSMSDPFYTLSASNNAVPVTIDHRQLFHEVLKRKLGFSSAQLSRVLPGYTDSGLRLFS